jgi:predicted PurR-regulated permease PerM
MTADPPRTPARGSGSTSQRRLRGVGEACLWVLVIGVTVVAAVSVAARLRLVVLPVLLAIVLATLLAPLARRLRERGWPDAAAALAVLLAFITVLGGVVAAAAPQAADEFGELDVGVSGGIEEVQRWLAEGPLGLSDRQVTEALDGVQEQVRGNVETLMAGALAGAAVLAEVLAGLALALVLLFFVLKDGERIAGWLVDLTPPARRDDVLEAGRRGWDALGGFLRAQTIVALFDAVFIGLALVLIGVPLVLPLVVLTFFGAYVPILGAAVAGLAAALVALFAGGPLDALLVIGAIVVVQQVESNVLQPFVVGRSVRVHPAAVLLAVTAGGVLAGVIGAMVATPVLAVAAAVLAVARERAGASGPGAEA